MPRSPNRRGATEVSERENETSVDNGNNWQGREIAVDDSQLVDWQSDAGQTASGANDNDDDFGDIGRKR